jgi:hypothetical protein
VSHLTNPIATLPRLRSSRARLVRWPTQLEDSKSQRGRFPLPVSRPDLGGWYFRGVTRVLHAATVVGSAAAATCIESGSGVLSAV